MGNVFWKTYPSLVYLNNKSTDELLVEFKTIATATIKDNTDLTFDCKQYSLYIIPNISYATIPQIKQAPTKQTNQHRNYYLPAINNT